MIIGVDIGGTNTDAVLIDENENLICFAKTATTEDISYGFYTAVKKALEKSRVRPDTIKGIYVGTTHATNAILQKKNLNQVGVIRLAGQRPDVLPVAYAWPKDLRDAVLFGSETIGGGFECHGGELSPLSDVEIRDAVKKLLENGVNSIAVIGVFSPLNDKQEKRVAEIIQECAGPLFPISVSSQIGGIGFIERENSTIINASLKKVMQMGFVSLQNKCDQLKLSCPLMITQNDGSLISIERAIEYPVLTISAGPTNSFIGGSKLAGLEDAIVVDIGGTSSDAGIVRRGFPLRSLNKSNIGGISLNFPMPDVLSIALGGGSVISYLKNEPIIGPESIAKKLMKDAVSFGGDMITLTDIALFKGYIDIGGAKVPLVPDADKIFDQVRTKLSDLVIKIRGEYTEFPVVLVGGGAALLASTLPGKHYQIPPSYQVANAYGAALAEVSGMVDTVLSLENREETLDKLYESAKKRALEQGADIKTLRLVDQQILPYSYVPNKMARVVVRFCGKKIR
ncbi:MAG: Acetophenone carboxylase gamma subunit [Chlamydiae bacterium]|nr:Acetophenone carboxylase gamma subunit [Chlamydiota bacterium]